MGLEAEEEVGKVKDRMANMMMANPSPSTGINFEGSSFFPGFVLLGKSFRGFFLGNFFHFRCETRSTFGQRGDSVRRRHSSSVKEFPTFAQQFKRGK